MLGRPRNHSPLDSCSAAAATASHVRSAPHLVSTCANRRPRGTCQIVIRLMRTTAQSSPEEFLMRTIEQKNSWQGTTLTGARRSIFILCPMGEHSIQPLGSSRPGGMILFAGLPPAAGPCACMTSPRSVLTQKQRHACVWLTGPNNLRSDEPVLLTTHRDFHIQLLLFSWIAGSQTFFPFSLLHCNTP